MADEQAALKLTQTWAVAATATSSHTRDYFVEAIRELQRKKEAQRQQSAPAKAEGQSD
jgi:hypothetical protein